MNILPNILRGRLKTDTLRADIFSSFYTYFTAKVGATFCLNRHTDPGMRNRAPIRILEAYGAHVLVEVLDEQDEGVYRTSVTYASLLDCDNSGTQYAYEIVQVYTAVSVIKS